MCKTTRHRTDIPSTHFAPAPLSSSSILAPPSTSGSTCNLILSNRSTSTSTPSPPSRGGASERASCSSYSSPKMRRDCLPPGGSTTLRVGLIPADPPVFPDLRGTVDLFESTAESCVGSAISACDRGQQSNIAFRVPGRVSRVCCEVKVGILTHIHEIGDRSVRGSLGKVTESGVLCKASVSTRDYL